MKINDLDEFHGACLFCSDLASVPVLRASPHSAVPRRVFVLAPLDYGKGLFTGTLSAQVSSDLKGLASSQSSLFFIYV